MSYSEDIAIAQSISAAVLLFAYLRAYGDVGIGEGDCFASEIAKTGAKEVAYQFAHLVFFTLSLLSGSSTRS